MLYYYLRLQTKYGLKVLKCWCWMSSCNVVFRFGNVDLIVWLISLVPFAGLISLHCGTAVRLASFVYDISRGFAIGSVIFGHYYCCYYCYCYYYYAYCCCFSGHGLSLVFSGFECLWALLTSFCILVFNVAFAYLTIDGVMVCYY